MDPVGPWSAYAASYNRLANAGSFQNPTSNDFHHHVTGGVQSGPSTTTQFLAAHATSSFGGSSASPFNPTGFLSPPPVGYDAVFPPLFHQKSHYGIQHRTFKQPETETYNQMPPNNFFDQNNSPNLAWSQNSTQLPSPFGILPHESVPNTSVGSEKTYDNVNIHFTSSQSSNLHNLQISDYKSLHFTDPKKRALSPSIKIANSTNFFQQTSVQSDANINCKQNDYLVKNFHYNSINQPYCMPSMVSQGKEYRIPQPVRPQFSSQRHEKQNFISPKPNIQKVTNKVFDNDKRLDLDSQSSPISFAMMDAQRNYEASKLRNQQFQNIPNQQNYRFPMTPESDYQRSRSTESFGSTSSNPDCNIGLQRRLSPLHAQASPNNVPSPVYPLYNSPLTTISSPSPVQQETYCTKQHEITPPLDVSVPRPSLPYSSVITRSDSRFDRQDYNRQPWDERQRRYPSNESSNGTNRHQYFDSSHQVSLQDLSSCRGDPMSLVKTLQQQQPEKNLEDKTKKKDKIMENSTETDYYHRMPPPAHHNNTNQSNQNGYYDSERWNLGPNSKIFPSSPAPYNSQPPISSNFSNQPQSLMFPHPSLPIPYIPTPSQIPHSQSPEESGSAETEINNSPKVMVPNIAEELRCLLENNPPDEDPKLKKKLPFNTVNSFITSFVKYLHGEKESSPPLNLRPVCKTLKSKIYQSTDNKNEVTKSVESLISVFPADPEDDPRYFPLPKSSDKRSFDSSDSDEDDSFSFSPKICKQVDEPSPKSPVTNKPSLKEEKKVSVKREKKKKPKKEKKKKFQKSKKVIDLNLPRRESSLRKAKELSVPMIDEDVEFENTIPELLNSDSDPAWDPIENICSDKKKMSKSRIFKKIVTSLTADSTDEDVSLVDRAEKKKKSKVKGYKNIKTTLPQIITAKSRLRSTSSKSNQFPFNIGDFVVLKSDLCLRHPPLWRVKEKNMLQKFLHFSKTGISHYQNIPFFSGWCSETNYVYEGLTVKILSVVKQDMVVQLLSTGIVDMNPEERAYVENSMEITLKYQDSFEVYIQTLFSQALDSKFLTEIFLERDEYFLSNISAIDDYNADLKKSLEEILCWDKDLISAVQLHSSYKSYSRNGEDCQCGTPCSFQFIISGSEYNKNTLKEIDGKCSSLELSLCRNCLSNVEVLHKLCHFKFSLYALCEEVVKEKRSTEPDKDTTTILNDLLTDEVWLNQVFKNVRWEWAYTETVIKKLKTHYQTLSTVEYN